MSAIAAVDPSTRPEILAALAEGESRIVNFFGELAPELFFRSPVGKWSLDGHLRHLTTGLERVGMGFAVPPAVLGLLGRSGGQGRGYAQLVGDYHAALAAGGRASGAFVPTPAADQSAGAQAKTLSGFQSASATLVRNMSKPGWTEDRLDSVTLPHPLLGQLSAREMLFFTVYHNLHHLSEARNSMEQQ